MAKKMNEKMINKAGGRKMPLEKMKKMKGGGSPLEKKASGKKMMRKGMGKKVDMDKRRGGMQMPMVENFNDMIKRRFGGKV
jgi:hypothetical protein